jgi:uncharacterized MAPEG superfamily protein
MTPELTALTLAALLQTLQFALMAIPVNLELGAKLTSSPRDGMNLASMVTPKTARLVRALNNHFEALILFTIAVLVVTLSNQSTPVTRYAAYTYLAARTLYVPAYYFGWQPWRSAIWMVSFAATFVMLIAALIP